MLDLLFLKKVVSHNDNSLNIQHKATQAQLQAGEYILAESRDA